MAIEEKIEPALSPQGHLYLAENQEESESTLPQNVAAGIAHAFKEGAGVGLLYLGGSLATATLPPAFGYWRDFGKVFFSRACVHPEIKKNPQSLDLEPSPTELEKFVNQAPPMKGAEYLTSEVLKTLWSSIEEAFLREYSHFKGSLQEYLKTKNEVWNVVGRVCLHLAENKQNPKRPFAFLATYAGPLSQESRVQHRPLGKALEEFSGNRKALLNLLIPIQKASEKSSFLKNLVDEGKIYHPLALEPAEALAFLKEIPLFEESGLVVRVPDWWAAKRPSRPQVNVTIGQKEASLLGADSLLDFSITVSLDGQPLTRRDLDEILKMSGGLVSLKGKWVELDPEKLKEALDHWENIQSLTSKGLMSYSEAMRLLAGLPAGGGREDSVPSESVREWSQVNAGEWLGQMLAELRHPDGTGKLDMKDWLHAELRPYQGKGVEWLWLLHHLGLGGCLADDMGLGKTIQVIGLLSGLKKKGFKKKHIVVVPASLIANWKSEANRFAPHLKILAAHPSEMPSQDLNALDESRLKNVDVVLVTYGGLARLNWPKEIQWGVVVLDEAQAIKNPNALQTKAAKTLKGMTRLALTGTPIENRLSDLWSLFDFICPGLLGNAKAFGNYAKKIANVSGTDAYGPIRTLVSPYILRRLKTDKRIIADLPEKTELKAYCPLTKIQASLYEQSVTALKRDLEKLAESENSEDKMKRRGIILAYLMRFKQICNHPSQWLGLTDGGGYKADQSGKFARLAEICEPIASRQEKCLVFTQFREMTGPLDTFLANLFKRKGLVLHGQTPVPKRKELVTAFQKDEQGSPYFILSLKAGGIGLNLTAASHVIHFDRWWNPAVEDQATDRAFRIGQKKNVLVHKFICRGTVEEKIDNLIESKKSLARTLLEADASPLLTEMSNEDLIKTVSLDIHRALGEGAE